MTIDPGDPRGGPTQPGEHRRQPLSRREFLGAVGGVAVGGALVGAGVELTTTDAPLARVRASQLIEPFYGVHQGGITTSPQRHTYLAALDVTAEKKRDVADLLRHWTSIAVRLTQGRTAGVLTDDSDHTEPDSGETLDLGAARLTVNFGFGPTLFAKDGYDRFELAGHRPYELVELPSFPGDQLITHRCDGDLTIHACSNDPQVAFHAVRQLARAANGVASIRWSQSGFNETAATSGTPRNLMGFKDGTMNPKTASEMDRFVWVGYEGPHWMTGGTYLVVRRIKISLEQWDTQSLATQEKTVGRYKTSGAPLGKSVELDALDLSAKDEHGRFLVPLDAHVRLASPEENWGATMLRRSYAYDDGVDAAIEGESPNHASPTFDAGLLFACYQRNPILAFIGIFRKLATNDALRKFTTHTGSAIVAIPPAAAGPGEWVGQRLFEA
jgi:deferrochelatase/peroxidase EfeB